MKASASALSRWRVRAVVALGTWAVLSLLSRPLAMTGVETFPIFSWSLYSTVPADDVAPELWVLLNDGSRQVFPVALDVGLLHHRRAVARLVHAWRASDEVEMARWRRRILELHLDRDQLAGEAPSALMLIEPGSDGRAPLVSWPSRVEGS